jgi:hypothetical protein
VLFRSYYAINNNGVVTFKFGPGPSTQPFQADVENTLNDFAARTEGASDGEGVANRTILQSRLQKQLEERAPQVGVRPSQTQPPPAAPGAQGGTDSGAQVPSSGIGTTYEFGKDVDKPFENELKGFEDPNKFEKLKPFLFYPEDIKASGQDKIVISQIEYIPAPLADQSNIYSTINVLSNRESNLTNILGSVVLPVPNEISEANSVGWGEDSLSAISASLMGSASGFAKEVAGGRIIAGYGELQKAFGNITDPAIKNRLEKFLVANAGASILKLGGINVNPEAYISRVTGTAINPNLELLFNGPKLRQFGFTFKLTPRSEKEAKHIRSIIKFFKKGMSPRRSSKGYRSIYLGTPNVFKVKFQSGGDENNGREIGGIGKIKTCALVSCTVNYTPDGFYAAYSDVNSSSQPIAVVLSLGFTELTPIYNDDYDAKNDGAENFIGPEINTQYKAEGSSTETPPVTYSQGARQGPTPGGQTLDTIPTQQQVNRAIQQTLIDAGSTQLPGGR